MEVIVAWGFGFVVGCAIIMFTIWFMNRIANKNKKEDEKNDGQR